MPGHWDEWRTTRSRRNGGQRGRAFFTILPKGCKLPCSAKQNFAARTADQPRIGFHLFRGNSPTVKSAHALGTVHISGFPPTPYGSTHVVVKFVADSSGITLSGKNIALELLLPNDVGGAEEGIDAQTTASTLEQSREGQAEQ